MEYSRSFAMIEAAVLVGVTLWLFYLNSSSSRHDGEGASEDEAGERQDERDKP